jgi:hypothetical protein
MELEIERREVEIEHEERQRIVEDWNLVNEEIGKEAGMIENTADDEIEGVDEVDEDFWLQKSKKKDCMWEERWM